MQTNQFPFQFSPSAILLVSIFTFHFFPYLAHCYQLSGETFPYSAHTHTHTHQNVRCHNLQDRNIKFVVTGIWNFMYYCCFLSDEPAVSSVRGTSCWVPFWGLHMRRMQGELVPRRCYVGAWSTMRANMALSKVRPSDDVECYGVWLSAVWYKIADVSEESTASIFRVIAYQTTPRHTSLMEQQLSLTTGRQCYRRHKNMGDAQQTDKPEWFYENMRIRNYFLLLTNLTHFSQCIYFTPLHVSSNKCSSSGGSNCVNTSSGIILCSGWLPCVPVGTQGN